MLANLVVLLVVALVLRALILLFGDLLFVVLFPVVLLAMVVLAVVVFTFCLFAAAVCLAVIFSRGVVPFFDAVVCCLLTPFAEVVMLALMASFGKDTAVSVVPAGQYWGPEMAFLALFFPTGLPFSMHIPAPAAEKKVKVLHFVTI